MGGGDPEKPFADFAEGEMPAGSNRSRTDFAGSSVRRMIRRTEKRGTEEHLAGRKRRRAEKRSNPSRNVPRVESEAGTFPGSVSPPRPPPVLVLYQDLVGEDELAWLGRPRPPEMPVAVYGQYPRALIAKMLPWLRCARHEVLHVCSGSLPPGEGIRVDIRPEAQPDILADGRALPLADGSQAAVMIDPPYTEHYAKHLYQVDYPRPSHLLREAARVVKPSGRIVFVHYITPKPAPGTRFVKAFGLSTGFDMPIRAVTVFERDPAEPDQGELDLGGAT